MSLQSGTRLGSYEIGDSLGAGGMGEVYRARDTRLNRDVAIKVLPDLFASDVERLSRFEREAQVLASLNHPHIAQVYGVIDAPAALVMELVEGEDLAQRIARGALPVPESLEVARQIADALEAAHDKGIIHRDLKPANIKLRDDGAVKVLDFGLAKAIEGPARGGPHAMNSPTITSPAALLRQGYGEAGTQMGVILGTAAYMAPEQAKGKTVDRGADLWAFGAVLYEMLTGKLAFDGETVTDVLAAIVTRDPDWNLLPTDTPASVQRLLRRCLERDRRKRLADAGEAQFQIEEALAASQPAAATAAPRGSSPLARVIPWAIATVLAVVAIVPLLRPAPAAEAPARYSFDLPQKSSLLLTSRPAVAVSPDGSTVVFVAASDGVERLYVRRIDSFDAQPLAGTEGGSHPVISPDGRWVAFMTNRKLLKMPLGGGPVVPLADVNDPRGLSWDSDDTITFTPTTIGGVFQLAAGGGQPLQVTTPKAEVERTHRWPQQLPGGSAVIYTVGDFSHPDSYDSATIDAYLPGSHERRTVLTGAAMARYVPTGHLVFVRGTTLFAVAFDPRTLEVKGTPAVVVQGVATDATTGAAHFAVSPSGSLVYVSAGAESAALRPMEVNRTGGIAPLALPLGNYSDPAISPDGQQLAYSAVTGGGRDIWVYNRIRKSPSRLTFGGQNVTPVWSRDGSMLYYVAREAAEAGSSIYRRRSDGSQEAEELVRIPSRLFYLEYLNPDEKTAVVEIITSGAAGSGIHQIALTSGAKPTPVLATRFNEYGGRLSPDGKWMAYVSTEAGRPEVYVRRATGTGGRWQVSANSGEEPKWSPNGRELYFRNGNLLMGVTVGGGQSFEASVPVQIIAGIHNLRNETGLSYDVEPKTGQFVMLRLGDEAAAANSLRVITSWFAELRAATTK